MDTTISTSSGVPNSQVGLVEELQNDQSGMSHKKKCILDITHSLNSDLKLCCGNPGGKHIYITLPSAAALQEYQVINSCPPKEAGKFALKLLGIFFSPSELAVSNCTKAEGRGLLNPNFNIGNKA